MKFKRFTKPEFLKQIGRPLLGQFFARFQGDLDAKGTVLPPAELEDDEYYQALGRVALGPDALPDGLIEAMFAIEEMANPEGQERLESGVAEAQLALTFRPDSTQAEIAVQVCLAAPDLLARKHNEVRLTRLASFEYFGSKSGVRHLTPALSPVEAERDKVGEATFTTPEQGTLDRIEADVDAWFATHNRGKGTVEIEVYVIEGEYWFVVRHGDTYARTPKVENGRMQVMHFRPAKDDVIVYSPQRDEIRIHAGTKGEKELYRETFGMRLFADDRYFSERKAFTLEPLRDLGSAALEVEAGGEIERIVLRELEVAWPGGFNDSIVLRSDDVFASAEGRGKDQAVPNGRLVRANFDVWFVGVKKPRKVQLRPPNVLKLGRHCDAAAIQRWLSDKGFRVVAATGNSTAAPLTVPARSEGNITHVEPVART